MVTFAQMSGSFKYFNDGRLYLVLQNNTSYTYTFKGAVYSPQRKIGNSEINTVYPGQGLYLGPSTPWAWTWYEGDIYTITYANGQTQTWTCPYTDYNGQNNPSFQGRTSYYGACAYCKCKLYNPISKANSYCKTCLNNGCGNRTWTSHTKCYY